MVLGARISILIWGGTRANKEYQCKIGEGKYTYARKR